MVITQEIFEAFLHCPTKSYLSSHTADGAEAALDRARRQWEELFRHAASSTVCTGIADDQLFVGSPTLEAIQQQQYRVILDYTVRASDLGANGHALQLARLRRAQGQSAARTRRRQAGDRWARSEVHERGHIAELVSRIHECQRRNSGLHVLVMDANEAWLSEHTRQAFRPRALGVLPDL